MAKLREKKVNFDDRVEALADFLKLDDEEKANIEEGYDDGYLDYDGDEYRVLTEDEAEEAFREAQEELWEELGLEAFSENFQDEIIDRFVDTDWFSEAKEESDRIYAEDIAQEDSRDFENRLVEECYERKLLKDKDFEEDGDGGTDYMQCKKDTDELIDMLVDDMSDEYDDPVEWYKDIFGEKQLSDIVRKNNLIDFDRVLELLEDYDGRGPTLASYDGVEEAIKVNGEWFYIYRTN